MRSGGPASWPRRARRAQVAAVVATVGLVLALAQQPVRGAFNGSTNSTGSQVSTASTFCTTPGNSTVTPSADSWVNEANPTRTAGGGDYAVQVVSGSPAGNGRVFVRFTLPVIPARCTLSAATLRLYTDAPDGGRTIGVYRADPTAPLWTEAALNWNNRPSAVDTAATALTVNTSGYLSWTVTAHVQTLYAGTNNGFVLRDELENSSSTFRQQYHSRDATYPAQLMVSWA